MLQPQKPLSNCSRNLQLREESGQENPWVGERILTPQQCSNPRLCSELCRNLSSVGICSMSLTFKPFQKGLRDGVSAFGKSVHNLIDYGVFSWLCGFGTAARKGSVKLCLLSRLWKSCIPDSEEFHPSVCGIRLLEV